MHRAALTLALMAPALPAAAGVPGDDAPIVSLHGTAVHDGEARDPLALGGELRAAFPFDLDLRGRLLHSRLPPREIEDDMRASPVPSDAEVPDRLAYSRWEARLQAGWSHHATERTSGLRMRAAALGIITGDSGATRKLEPIGWSPDYTAAFKFGPTLAIGWAAPLADTPTAALLDVRLGASLALPVTAGGGRLSNLEDYPWVLEIDDQTYRPAQLTGRETRAWIEGNLTYKRLILSAELGLEHNARSAVRRARIDSPDWDVTDTPEKVAPHIAIQVGAIF